ncbi:cytidine deaminase [Streptomyces sp. NPDC058372]|uniref:cytidine deaminase n=1 Tax=unclassified Streptomyces TaxID=2593676 RepID=UPI00364AFE52
MALDQELVDAAREQLDRRWPADEDGGAAAVRLADGRVLTSVGLDNMNMSVALCHETGALIQAYTLDVPVTATVCLGRDRARDRLIVLPPCGICQERLALWGPRVEAAVPDHAAPGGWRAATLAELNPHYWGLQFTEDGSWPSYTEHST